MGALEALQMKSKRLSEIDMGEIFIRVMAISGVAEKIIYLNQNQMYVEGVDSKGVTLGEYTPFTKFMKDLIGERTDHITLYMHGDFYRSMKVEEIDNNKVVITGETEKEDQDLADRWPDALGLTQESIEELRPMINQYFLQEFRKEANTILYG